MTIDHLGTSLPAALTAEQRAELEAWADAEGHPRTGYQVFDETDSTDDNYAEVKFGGRFDTYEEALAWVENHPEQPVAWTIYGVRRAVTRDREVWYMENSSPRHTNW
jgi:hypothetical protein